MAKKIRQKERDVVIQSLRAGVVPRLGLPLIQVGRNKEVQSFMKDIETVSDGGTAFRLVIGEYGSGKTFFMSLVRSIALQKGLVTMNADLSPSKRLHGSNGQSQKLLSELISSISTRVRPDGNALENILDKFLSECIQTGEEEGKSAEKVAAERLEELKDYTGGFAFSKVVQTYCRAYEYGDDIKKNACLRWLRAEYTTKTDALREVGVREYISDNDFFSTLILYSVLVRKAGFKGLYITLDEMVNLYKISASQSRKANYEEILSILNNTLQGNVEGIGFVMGGTPEFLTDANRGLYSYEALRSRLAENSFSTDLGVADFNSTVLRLSNLSEEEMYVLLQNLRNVFAYGDKNAYLVPDKALLAYLNHCSEKIGESYFRTPRNTIKGFIDLLSLLEQYPEKSWEDAIADIKVEKDKAPSNLDTSKQDDKDEDEAFSSFKF